jgi:uncharacterized membrane protein YdjX (TVP38/TMEM64 family)
MEAMAEAKADEVPSTRRWLVPALAFLTVLAVGWLLKAQLAEVAGWVSGQVLAFAQWVKTLGPWGPLVFIAGYVVAVVGFVPASLLTIGAGTIFGVVAGTAWVFVAASLGACAAFALARTVARGAVERRILANPRFAAIDRAIAKDGRKIAVLLRLSPVIPFALLNYALGLTRIRFADYAIACIAMLPGTLLYVYIGSLVGDLAAVAAGSAASEGEGLQRAFKLAGLAVTAFVTVMITRIARRALADATHELRPG